MEYEDDKRPSLNGHDARQRENPQYGSVPATLLPAVLSLLGLSDRPIAEGDRTEVALRDESIPVRVAAVRRLGERRDLFTLQFLVSALHDPAWEVRVAAVWALSAFREYTLVEALQEALADEDGSVRAAALRALARVSIQVPLEPLARLLHDTEWQVREAAAMTVEELREQVRLGSLAAASREEDEAAQMMRKPSQSVASSLTLQGAISNEMLGARYLLQDSIGQGGMATIYRARDIRTGSVVAVKVLREVYITNPKFVTRFQREAKAASTLQHPNIVRVYDYGQVESTYYIVMELVEGTDLRRYLRSRGVLDNIRTTIIAHDIALGLAAAHRRGIVHRDVKPQNILVDRGGSIKLTDFGIASVYRGINALRLTTTGMTLGTVEYMAPEQAQGEIVSPAADVYALGIVLYEMLTGRTPFVGDTLVAVAMQHIQDAPTPPSRFNPNISPALEEIILRCLEKLPEMRYRDGSQLARALESLGDAEFAETIANTPGSQRVPGGQVAAQPGTFGSIAVQSEQASPFLPHYMLPISGSADSHGASSEPLPVVASQPPHAGHATRFKDSRLAIAVTVAILLAILLLSGFSAYLGIQLGFINLPFNNSGGAPTPAIVTGIVPDLRGLTYTAAAALARQDGFTLQLSGTPRDGIVLEQNPQPGARYTTGKPIVVTMTTRTTVPTYKPGAKLVVVEQLILAAHLQYQVKPDKNDPTVPANTVSRLDPVSGTQLQINTTVTIYVTNLNATPGASPTPSPSPGPSPMPTNDLLPTP